MRIRIVRALPIRDVDGITLDAFEVGRDYDVSTRLGALFLAEGWAEPVTTGAVRVRGRRAKAAVAAERARKTPRRRR
jgi:hypothetical protein